MARVVHVGVTVTHRLHGSSFLGIPSRILNMNYEKELLWSLWVSSSSGPLSWPGTEKWTLPKIRGALFWGPYNKDPTIQGTTLGSLIFGNPQMDPKPDNPTVQQGDLTEKWTLNRIFQQGKG